MQDEYSNAMNFCHGDIYRNVIAARREGDEALEGRWLGRLNPSLRKDLGLFLKKEGYQELRSAFNSLLPFVGLWPSLKLGCLRRIFQLHQPEELAHYLMTVREIWSSILLYRNDLFACLDHETVQALQLRNPSRYKADLVCVKTRMESGIIFTRIKDESTRSAIATRLLAIDVCIPSIETFLEDTKWLEPCSAAVREHIVPKSSLSLFRSLSRSFVCKDDHLVDGGKKENFMFAYRSLFASAWRFFPELSGISPKQNQSGPKRLSNVHNDFLQHEFKKLAAELGFRLSKDVSDICSPEKVMIRKFLTTVRPPDLYEVHQEIEEELIDKIYGVIQDSYRQCNLVKPSASQNSTPGLRCGRPSFEVWNSARIFFKYEHLYKHGGDNGAFFADQRDIFVLFFGKHDGFLRPDAAESASFPAQPTDLTTNPTDSPAQAAEVVSDTSLVQAESMDLTTNPTDGPAQAAEVASDTSLIQAQSAVDYWDNNSSASSDSPVLFSAKRRREDGQPIEKEPRLAPESKTLSRTWLLNNVFQKAKEAGAITGSTTSLSHIVVFNSSKNDVDIRKRDEIADILQAHSSQSFCVETQQNSTVGSRTVLRSLSQNTFKSSSLVDVNLLIMYKGRAEYMEVLKFYKEDELQIWRHILKSTFQI